MTRKEVFRSLSLLILLFWGVCSASALSAGPLSAQEKKGRQVYAKGIGPSGGTIKAFVGNESMETPGSVVPCVNCHGYDGLGKAEAGVYPSNITWKELTKPYTVRYAKGRERLPYTEKTLVRAITEGIDSSGNRLDRVMPRYAAAKEDMETLVSFLKLLGTDIEPGISRTAIRLGTVVPGSGPLSEPASASKAVMAAYFKELNDKGGIHNRKIELVVSEFGGAKPLMMEVVRYLVEKEEVFAMVGPVFPGADSDLSEFIENEEVPVIGPFTDSAYDGSILQHFTFYILSGLREQTKAFLEYAENHLEVSNRRLALVYPEDGVSSETIEAIEEYLKKHGWSSFVKAGYREGGFDAVSERRRLAGQNIETVLFLGSWQELKALMDQGEEIGWKPNIFLPGSRVRREIFELFPSFTRKVFLSYPLLPSDQTEAGTREFKSFLERNGLPAKYGTIQILAYTSARILAEGLKQAGRDLNREKFVLMLERLYEFNTEMTPRISYGPNRRVGAKGAYIVAVDPEKKYFVPISEWIAVE